MRASSGVSGAGLEMMGAAGQKPGGDAVGDQRQRRIPRRDDRDHPDRLANDLRLAADHVARLGEVGLGAELAVELEKRRPVIDDESGEALRRTDLRRPNVDQQRQTLFQFFADRGDVFGALLNRHPRPRTVIERLPGGAHRAVEVRLRCLRPRTKHSSVTGEISSSFRSDSGLVHSPPT